MEAKLDPITDIFRTLHVTAFGQHRLEATAPGGLIQGAQTEEKKTPSDKKISPKDLAHFAMLSRGNCWLSVEGFPFFFQAEDGIRFYKVTGVQTCTLPI